MVTSTRRHVSARAHTHRFSRMRQVLLCTAERPSGMCPLAINDSTRPSLGVCLIPTDPQRSITPSGHHRGCQPPSPRLCVLGGSKQEKGPEQLRRSKVHTCPLPSPVTAMCRKEGVLRSAASQHMLTRQVSATVLSPPVVSVALPKSDSKGDRAPSEGQYEVETPCSPSKAPTVCPGSSASAVCQRTLLELHSCPQLPWTRPCGQLMPPELHVQPGPFHTQQCALRAARPGLGADRAWSSAPVESQCGLNAIHPRRAEGLTVPVRQTARSGSHLSGRRHHASGTAVCQDGAGRLPSRQAAWRHVSLTRNPPPPLYPAKAKAKALLKCHLLPI